MITVDQRPVRGAGGIGIVELAKVVYETKQRGVGNGASENV